MSAPKPSAGKAANRVIFNATEVAAHLARLRAEAKEGEPWWTGVLKFEWTAVRKGNQGTQWLSLNYVNEQGIEGRMILRIKGEKHSGQIMPNTEEGVAELTRITKNPKVVIKSRGTKKPAIQFQKWAAIVKTAEDEITIPVDADGNPILPGDDKLSPYYRVAECVNDAFTAEARERIDLGARFVMELTGAKAKDKSLTAAAALAAFNAANARRPGDMIVSTDSAAALRKAFNPGADVLLKGVALASNTKIAELTQTLISSEAKKNGGLPMPNPLTRLQMEFDKDTQVAGFAIHDKSKPFIAEGRQQYDPATVAPVGVDDGTEEPINGTNVHKFVRSGVVVDGIADMSGVCFSNMGISMPNKITVAIITPRTGGKASLDDVYGDDNDEPLVGEVKDAPKPAAAKPAAAKPAAAKAPAKPAAATKAAAKTPAKPAAKAAPRPAEPEEGGDDFDGMLDELGGGDE